MPKTKQDPQKRRQYSMARTVTKPYTVKDMMSPLKTMAGRKRVVLGDKKK